MTSFGINCCRLMNPNIDRGEHHQRAACVPPLLPAPRLYHNAAHASMSYPQDTTATTTADMASLATLFDTANADAPDLLTAFLRSRGIQCPEDIGPLTIRKHII